MNMLTGRFAKQEATNRVTGSMWFHIGANTDERTQVFIGTMTAKALSIRNDDNSAISLESIHSSNIALDTLDKVLTKVSTQRATLGAYQNRLEYTIKGIEIANENFQTSESKITDTNMATQMVSYTRNMLLDDAATAMLVQANQRPQAVLQLLR
jgi:flagellin